MTWYKIIIENESTGQRKTWLTSKLGAKILRYLIQSKFNEWSKE